MSYFSFSSINAAFIKAGISAGLWGFIALISFSCSFEKNTPPDENALLSGFFDVQSYFRNEISRLNKEQPSITKRIELEGQLENIQKKGLDYERELQVFVNSDINRVSWKEKYKVDSIFQEAKLVKIRYEAIDTTLKTKLLEVEFEKTEVRSVKIHNATRSIVAQTNQILQYHPTEGYSIENEQKILFSKTRKLFLEVNFKT